MAFYWSPQKGVKARDAVYAYGLTKLGRERVRVRLPSANLLYLRLHPDQLRQQTTSTSLIRPLDSGEREREKEKAFMGHCNHKNHLLESLGWPLGMPLTRSIKDRESL